MAGAGRAGWCLGQSGMFMKEQQIERKYAEAVGGLRQGSSFLELGSITGRGVGSKKVVTGIQKGWGWSGAGAGEGNEEKGKTPRAGSGAWGDRTCSARIPCSLQVKQNLLSVSYHIAQYTSIIADLRGEIQRLKCKIDEQGGRGQARERLERGDIRHIQGVCVWGGRPR